ncbi:flagellar protein [Shinella curvata]|uniref:Flagellar protein n=1 Tax=Shinella curvata TaxID=1817964 RepID=A0ABT8XBQ9_9HYPH|nr:flagellar protein [Shinella curvata]MCJ8054021.1 flagellar protein [Shinella curvata]MDO6121043.1 flagellar protein [Shinella curvata]
MTVTDFDADEAVQPLKRSVRRGYSVADKVLVGTGVMLAAMAAFFPWYVFLNPEKFSVPALWDGTTRNLPETRAKEVVSVSPAAMVDDDNEPALKGVDPVATASATDEGKETKLGVPVESGLDQPLPASTGFRLMHVANGRALIEDARGMYIVRVGSILPDNSRLATLEQREGAWVIVTSNGDVIKRN